MLSSPLVNVLRTTKHHLKKLDSMGIVTVQDLLNFFPRALESAETTSTVAGIVLGEKNTLEGTLQSFSKERAKSGKFFGKGVMVLDDGTTLEVVWFQIPYNLKSVVFPRRLFLLGKVERNYGRLKIMNPEVHLEANVHVGGIRPVYPESPPITAKWLREKISGLLTLAKDFKDPLPPEILAAENLMDLATAIKKIHFPASTEEWFEAKRRLGFQEIFEIQVRVLQAKFYREQTHKNPYQVDFDPEQIKKDLALLPFTLTDHQKKALLDILEDFKRDRSMHRLLQGDVGSGKTIVAFLAALHLVRAGYQTAILAPTEILAQQHYAGLLEFVKRVMPEPTQNDSTLLAGESTDECALLTGSVTAKNKKIIKEKLRLGHLKFLVGTHAILTEDTVFKNLALAVIDEQHRFGVQQRASLAENNAHVIAMTATPIPRSLALTIYGDQDLSVIGEKPAGRKDIITRIVADSKTEILCYRFIDDQIIKGRQIFWVCPLVDESEAIEAKNVLAEYVRINEQLFPKHRVEFLHGKMKPKDKDAIMKRFKNHEFDILVSTSVIEVGVDIPNSTVMVIENAERFGLAQLHQFRGRIGRNDYQSYCFLMVGDKKDKSKERLKAMEASNDGFYLSEVDLKLRGSGEVYGLKQSGLPDLKCADFTNVEAMQSARDWATKILEQDLTLGKYPRLKQRIESETVYF
jgi:ATP-dependent DNA helicase RecG